MSVQSVITAAADALQVVANSSTDPEALAAVNEHSDSFVQSLKATHDSLQAQIDRGLEPQPVGHAVQTPRAHAQIVGLRAALMGDHLAAMQAKMDDASRRRQNS